MATRMRRTTTKTPPRPKLPAGRAEGEPERKGDRLRRLVAAEQWYPALKLAASLSRLGEDKRTIERAWAAMERPDFAIEIGRDPAKLIEAGREVLRRRYGSSRRASR